MLDARGWVTAVNHGDTAGGALLQVTEETRSGIGQRIALTQRMTSNLPVVGAAVKAEPTQVARESFGVGLGGSVSTVAAERDFASVLAEVMSSARISAPASSTSAASTKAGELLRPNERANGLANASSSELEARARMERALLAEDSGRWLAAPMVYRAIDAYRELMNVSA